MTFSNQKPLPRSFLFFVCCFLAVMLIFIDGDQLDSAYTSYLGKTITRIDFTGNKFISNNEMLDLIHARPGFILTKDIVNEDIKKIYAQGSFSNVRLLAKNYKKGVAIEFILDERSYIEEIEFKGLDELTEKEVKDAILFQEEDIYSENLISESIAILQLQYEEKGFFNASIKVKVEPTEDKKGLKVSFLIDEGEEIKVIKITILGTRVLDPSDVLDSMELEEDGFLDDGKFKEETFEKDKENILAFMREKGFLDAQLLESSWKIIWLDETKEERGIEVTIRVQEGDKYFFNGYDIEWDPKAINQNTKKPLFKEDQLYALFEYTESDIGDVYNDTKIKNDGGIINYLYSQEGYIFTRVQPIRTTIVLSEANIKKWRASTVQKKYAKEGIDYYSLDALEEILKENPQAAGRKYIHTKFVISEGDKGFIEQIIIKGNEKTQDKVIRREILVREGQLFNAILVQRSRERIFNLQFFKEVGIDVRPGSSERKLNLIIEVQEQPTGNISLGGGFGTQAGFTIFTELAENNLNGTGQRIAGKIDFGPNRAALSTSWTNPWLFDEPWNLTLSMSYSNITTSRNVPVIQLGIQNQNATVDYESFGVGGRVDHFFAINWGHYHGWYPGFSREKNPTSLVDDIVYLRVNQGWLFRNSVVNGIYYDTRDNTFNTTSGMRAEFQFTTTGSFLGGSDHYLRYEPKYQFYWWPLDFTFFGLFRKAALRRWRFVFEHRISMGFTQVTGPVYGSQTRAENPYIKSNAYYFFGGYETVRGWRPRGNDDRDHPPSWLRFGGSHRILFGSELRIPIEPSLIWFVFFFEGGALFHDLDNVVLDNNIIIGGTQYNQVRQTDLNKRNLRPDYFKYSWGFGIRIQIPILPIRFYLAKKVIWDTNIGFFRELHPDEGFVFEFGIADRRF